MEELQHAIEEIVALRSDQRLTMAFKGLTTLLSAIRPGPDDALRREFVVYSRQFADELQQVSQRLSEYAKQEAGGMKTRLEATTNELSGALVRLTETNEVVEAAEQQRAALEKHTADLQKALTTLAEQEDRKVRLEQKIVEATGVVSDLERTVEETQNNSGNADSSETMAGTIAGLIDRVAGAERRFMDSFASIRDELSEHLADDKAIVNALEAAHGRHDDGRLTLINEIAERLLRLDGILAENVESIAHGSDA